VNEIILTSKIRVKQGRLREAFQKGCTDHRIIECTKYGALLLSGEVQPVDVAKA
jgi:hypothetical protein